MHPPSGLRLSGESLTNVVSLCQWVHPKARSLGRKITVAGNYKEKPMDVSTFIYATLGVFSAVIAYALYKDIVYHWRARIQKRELRR